MAQPQSKFGGVPVEDEPQSKFGGLPASASPDAPAPSIPGSQPGHDVPGANPAERRAYIHAHPEAQPPAATQPASAPVEGSALSRFAKGLVSPITGALGDIKDYATDPHWRWSEH